MNLERVTVRLNLKAGLEIEKTVPMWEVPLLIAIHPTDSVFEVGREAYEADFDPKEEWEKLLRRYGTATNEEGKQIVRLVYPNFNVLDREVDRMLTPPVPRGKRRSAQADESIAIP